MTDSTGYAGAQGEEISRLLVLLTKARSGKGPTRARTYITDDVVICLLGDGMTQVEKTLVADGRESMVAEMRASLQASFRDEAVRGVEQVVGRNVISFQSSHDLHNDVAAEIFVLESPPGPDGDD